MLRPAFGSNKSISKENDTGENVDILGWVVDILENNTEVEWLAGVSWCHNAVPVKYYEVMCLLYTTRGSTL